MTKRRGRSTKKKTIKVPSSSSSSSLQSIQHPLYNRINDLPDDLLCHILSFLPTKQAFTTTILSRRWTTLFYSLLVLDFKHDYFEDCETFHQFRRFVDTITLSPLSTNKPLKKFRLSYCWLGNNEDCYHRIFNERLASWLEATKQRRVKEIHLNLYRHTLNPIIFISQTLVVLKLKWLKLDIDTSCVDLPSLKTLLLKYVSFQNRNDYVNFLSACPNLEDLHAKSIRIHAKMNLDQNIAPEEGFKSLTLSKLVRANINSRDGFFNGIESVELLLTITRFIEQETSFKVIPLFPKLVHIELVLCHRSLHCWDGVLELLRHCPKLQILYIDKWVNTSSSQEWKCPIWALECVSSHLRSCAVLNFQGSDNDLKFVTYILQNANLLQNIKIGFATIGMFLEKSLIIEELSSCPRISPRCKISFDGL